MFSDTCLTGIADQPGLVQRRRGCQCRMGAPVARQTPVTRYAVQQEEMKSKKRAQGLLVRQYLQGRYVTTRPTGGWLGCLVITIAGAHPIETRGRPGECYLDILI